MNALVVEDDPVCRQMLADTLEYLGYEVRTAENGLAAMRLQTRSPARLVITDLMMPEMDGLELCKALRDCEVGEYVYILMLTAREDKASLIDAHTCGADDFMAKPFEPAELTVRLRTAKRILSLETRDMTIFALAKLAESRDNETGQHLERVRDYTLALAKQLAGHPTLGEEITSTFLRLIYQTSPLHDIGKVAIPDHVLLKPGRLDDREFEIMKTHAQAGADTLALALAEYPQAEFLQMAYDIARAHHERWDGRGYPLGLVGSAIPLAARIFSVADVYDALVSKRVYKEAYTHDVARGIIVSEEGKQFDPDVIAAFSLCEQQFLAISLRGSDKPAEQPHPAESIPA